MRLAPAWPAGGPVEGRAPLETASQRGLHEVLVEQIHEHQRHRVLDLVAGVLVDAHELVLVVGVDGDSLLALEGFDVLEPDTYREFIRSAAARITRSSWEPQR